MFWSQGLRGTARGGSSDGIGIGLGVDFEIAEQHLQEGAICAAWMLVPQGSLAEPVPSQHDIGIGGAIGELQAAGDPDIDGGVGIGRHLRAGLGEMQSQAAAAGGAPLR